MTDSASASPQPAQAYPPIPPDERGPILVTGATGQQGGAVARHLLAAGFPVRALTRDPDKPAAQALAARGATLVRGDLTDRASVDRAVAGAAGVFSVQNYYEAGGPEGEVRQGAALADAAKAAGVRHLVYSSVGSADRQTGIPHFESKARIEEHVRGLGVSYTILRPVFFMDNWERSRDAIRGGVLAQPLDPEKPLQQVAVDDIGAFAALAFADPAAWGGRAVDLAGDELTMPRAAEVFARALGRPVRYERIPLDRFRQAAGAETAALFAWFDDVGYAADIPALRAAYPPLATLERYLHDAGWAGESADAARP